MIPRSRDGLAEVGMPRLDGCVWRILLLDVACMQTIRDS